MKNYVIIVILLAVAYTAGRFTGPKKVEIKEVERVVYKEREQSTKDKHVTTVKREETKPDGTKVKETTRTVDERTETDRGREINTVKETIKVVSNRPDWRLSVAYIPNIPTYQTEVYRFDLQRRIIGEIYAGVQVDTNKTIGLSISIGF